MLNLHFPNTHFLTQTYLMLKIFTDSIYGKKKKKKEWGGPFHFKQCMWCLPFLFWILNYTSQTHFLIQTHLMLKIYTYTIFGRKKKKDHFNRMWCLHFSIFDVKLPFLEFTTAFVSCSVSFRVECIPNSIIIVHQYHVFFFFYRCYSRYNDTGSTNIQNIQ